jgi:hypothetical protein
MNVDQVHAEELAESRRRREAAQNATDDGMPMAPDSDEQDVEAIPYRKPKQGIRPARKWPDAECGLM